MKKLNKKGFTIVELVIVIAVIAILAGVLIPTFSGVVQRANQSAAQQQAASAMKVVLAMTDNAVISEGSLFVVKSGNKYYYYEYSGNKLTDSDAKTLLPSSIMNIIVSNDATDSSKNEDTIDILKEVVPKIDDTHSLIPNSPISISAGLKKYTVKFKFADGDDDDADPDEVTKDAYYTPDFKCSVVVFIKEVTA